MCSKRFPGVGDAPKIRPSNRPAACPPTPLSVDNKPDVRAVYRARIRPRSRGVWDYSGRGIACSYRHDAVAAVVIVADAVVFVRRRSCLRARFTLTPGAAFSSVRFETRVNTTSAVRAHGFRAFAPAVSPIVVFDRGRRRV